MNTDQKKVYSQQLKKSKTFLSKVNEEYLVHLDEIRQNYEFIKYKDSPDEPRMNSIASVTMYLRMWQSKSENEDIQDVLHRVPYVCKVMDKLMDVINYPLNSSTDKIIDWKMLHKEFRETLRKCVAHASFELLSRRDEQLERIGLNLYNYKILSEDLQVHIWSLTSLPEPNLHVSEEYSVGECSFPAMGLHISLPESLKGKYMTIRGMYTSYDHYSNESNSFELPEGCDKQDIDHSRSDFKKLYEMKLEPDEINLRNYVILGGIIEIHLFEHIPQPKQLFHKWTLTTYASVSVIFRTKIE